MKPTREELARLALTTLDAQRKYFRTRAREDLERCKDLERMLRRQAEQALEPAGLFDQPGRDA